MKVEISIDLLLLLRMVGEGGESEVQLRCYLAELSHELLTVAEAMASETEEGSVKWFDDSKGYGFIRDAGNEDVFVHWRGIAGEASYKTLVKGSVVRFKRRALERGGFEALGVEPVTSD